MNWQLSAPDGPLAIAMNRLTKFTLYKVRNYSGECLVSFPLNRRLIILLQNRITPNSIYKIKADIRMLAERLIADLCLKYQTSHALNSQIWNAIRVRQCQFLGPAVQTEVLSLLILLLGSGAALARGVIIKYILAQLLPTFPRITRSSLGNAIQLLYRGECFDVMPLPGAASLLCLKEEFRSYDSLRREHDRQLVKIAVEAGLRIVPDQWSQLLYGDSLHTSYMQSIRASIHEQPPLELLLHNLKHFMRLSNQDELICKLGTAFNDLAAYDHIDDNNLWQKLPSVIDAIRTLLACLIEVGEFKN